MFVDRIMEMGERFGKCRVLTAPGRCPIFHNYYVLLLILKRFKIDLITSSEHSRWGMDVLQLNFHNCVFHVRVLFGVGPFPCFFYLKG